MLQYTPTILVQCVDVQYSWRAVALSMQSLCGKLLSSPSLVSVSDSGLLFADYFGLCTVLTPAVTDSKPFKNLNNTLVISGHDSVSLVYKKR